MKKRVTIKKISITAVIWLFGLFFLTGCQEEGGLLAYEEYYQANIDSYLMEEHKGMAEDLVVIPKGKEVNASGVSNVKAAFSVNTETKDALAAHHAFDKMYPASITKLMTALLTLEHADFEDEVTLTYDITFDEGNVVRSLLKKGDTVTIEGLFNALLVSSDNDCAVLLAEHIAGSVEEFAKMMNQRASELGATDTHFVNANGLHNDDHYTTAYDLYLIFREVLKHDRFVSVVGQKDYVLEFKTADGKRVEEYKLNTNAFFKNDYPIPTGIEIVGGKTGTTSMAKSCLILLTKNKEKQDMISVVLGAETKDILYGTMSDLIAAE